MFHDLAGDLHSLVGSRRSLRLEAVSESWTHPGRSARIWIDEVAAGTVAQVHPQLAEQLDLTGSVYAFELDLDVLAQFPLPHAEDVSRFPSVRRDLALVLPAAIEFSRVAAVLREAAGGQYELNSRKLHQNGLPVGQLSLSRMALKSA